MCGKNAPEQQEDGQTARAGHEGDDGDGDEPALSVFDGAGCHDGRHVAAEAHDHGDEALAVQANLVHEFIHDESCAGHIPAVFQDGNEEVQDKDVGQEHQHAAAAGDDAVYQQVPEPPRGHPSCHLATEPVYPRVNPVHRVLADGKGSPEDKPQQQKEDREREPLVGDKGVDFVGKGTPRPGGVILLVSLG